MLSDRVNELYHRQIFGKSTQDICRERVHWMCSSVIGEHVLDFGCSQGIASILLAREGHQVVGVDVDPDVIEYAQAELKKEKESVRERVRFVLIKPGQLELDDASFDSVLFGEVLEHLTRPDRALSAIQRLCKPEGRVIITTPFGHFPDPNHVYTYYLRDFLKAIRPFFGVRELFLSEKYICCLAINSGPEEGTSDVVDAARLLEITEGRFRRVELDHDTRWERLSHQHQIASEKLTKAADQIADLQETAEQAEEISAKLKHGIERRDVETKLLAERQKAELMELRASQTKALAQLRAEHEPAIAQSRDQIRELEKALRSQEALRQKIEQTYSTDLQTAKREKIKVENEVACTIGEMQKARDDLSRTRCELSKVRDDLAAARKESEVLRASQRELQRSRDSAKGAAATLQSRYARQKDQLEYARAELNLKSKEVRYRLGDALISAYYHPTDLIYLPHRTVRLFLDGRRRSRQRALEGISEAALLAPPAPQRVAAPRAIAVPPAERTQATATPTDSAAPSPAVAAEPKPSPQTPKFEFVPVEVPDGPPRLSIKMAAVLDEFTYQCFKPECSILAVTPQDWKQKLETECPDFLFVESAWKGNGGTWQSQLTRAQHIKDSPLLEMVEWCKARKIPTVFWNKEDPPNFEHFIYVAKNFDHIFTTDENCIPRYREHVSHDRIYALPFAAQPCIHNPVGSQGERYGNLCFAGTYYAKRHASRRGDIDLLLQPALKHGLTIFDRMHGYTKSDYYRFPPEYADAIHGSLSYPEMVDAYKRFNVFLNVNSVTDSPTMFSRRVLELLACGTPVISTYALGIEKLLGRDAVALVESPKDARRWMDRLLSDTDFADRMVLRGQRRIFSEHTYARRLRTVLEKIGLAAKESPRRVSVVTCTNRPDSIENIIENYERQVWPEKELVLVLNSDSFNIEDVRRRLANVSDARVFQVPEERSLGECLNRAIDETDYEYWTKFDDDNFHSENFLTDLMAAFTYTDAGVVGKCSYFAYLEGPRCLALRFPQQEHRYVNFLSGSAMIVQRRVLDEVRFPEQSVGEDTQFLKACVEKGFRMYSTDRFNYVVRRAASTDEHTWKIETDEYLKKCRVVAHTDDYMARVVA